jgi:hypothetical protein
MSRPLWTISVDRRAIAVVAAAGSDEARRIARALAEHGDMPAETEAAAITRCAPAHAARTVALARRLGCAESFLACIGGGLFLTDIGGLA